MVKGIIQFGSALLKGDFDQAFKSGSAVYPIDPSTYRTSEVGNGWGFSVGDGDYRYFKYDNLGMSIKAYEKCPAVSAIINKKAQCFIDGKLYVMNNKGKEASSVQATALRKLLSRPNLLQSQAEFIAQMYIYVQLFGFCPVIAIKRIGFNNAIDAKALWNIPPNYIDFEYTQKLFRQTALGEVISHIYVKYNGERIPIPTEDIMIVRDISPALSGNMIFPDSRIKQLEDPINNSIGAWQSRNVLINYRGALGIFSKDTAGSGAGVGIPTLPVTKEEKDQLQKDFKRYGLRGNQWQFIITTAALKWQSVSVPTKDLMLFEEVDAATMSICDRYNYPYQLMAAAKGTTFSNVAEGNRILYQGAILPEAKSLFTQLEAFFKLSDYNLSLDMDYSDVAVLQEDKGLQATARKTRDDAYAIEYDNNVVTRDEWRIANGEDAVTDGTGNLYKYQLASVDTVPLILAIGAEGVTAVTAIISNPSIPEPNAIALLISGFNISPARAKALVTGKIVNLNTSTNEQSTTTETTEDAASEAA